MAMGQRQQAAVQFRVALKLDNHAEARLNLATLFGRPEWTSPGPPSRAAACVPQPDSRRNAYAVTRASILIQLPTLVQREVDHANMVGVETARLISSDVG